MIYISQLTDENYADFTRKDGLVLVDIYADWCSPCKVISPIIDQISAEYVGKLSVGKLDADKWKSTLEGLAVRNIPTLILYKNGEIVNRTVGAVTKEKLSETINSHLDVG